MATGPSVHGSVMDQRAEGRAWLSHHPLMSSPANLAFSSLSVPICTLDC